MSIFHNNCFYSIKENQSLVECIYHLFLYLIAPTYVSNTTFIIKA